VEGPAGIGKTALLEAGRRCARTRGLRVLHARASELKITTQIEDAAGNVQGVSSTYETI
jgi:hypothetical protein